ncbi:MAG: type II toxin-antitoxin system HicA family toxin [Candidatus Rokubacteria bacterium]|nr:type II toxin-antitoxin system HicA family toxin [Candidatus Rokubacteria bacterium]
MRLPPDLSGNDLAHALRIFGYGVTRQTGSHLRLTTVEQGEHHVTVPRHAALRVGTLAAILSDVGRHVGLTRDEVAERLFGGGRGRKV